MMLSDFTKQPRGPYAFDYCLANQTIATPMGEFTVELQMAVGGNTPSDDAMVRRADEFVALIRVQFEKTHDKVFEHYQMAAEDGEWLESCGVPEGLDRVGIVQHLQVRSLSVRRDENAVEEYSSRVFVVPDWDEEHAIYRAYSDGKWEFVDC